ncbi:hypothetical protein [Enterococcus faecium]|uniref:hypothetical protein n=1 Tax=Enterococcus faecium TaxID=1352 RepID=UPI0022356273|nr:hypothetical protein [Enterococcus faecium]
MWTLEGKTFAQIWTEFIEVPTHVDPITSEKVLDVDFYNLKAGTSLECVWMYLEEHFKGVTLGHVLYHSGDEWDEIGNIYFS